jgi:alkyldihydroxyacetonephosphate synthase
MSANSSVDVTDALELDGLRAVLGGSDRVLTDPDELSKRTRDWWPLARLREVRGDELVRPDAVVLPRTTEEVAAVLRWAYENRVSVITRGLGSGVCGGALPIVGSIVVDMSAMNSILDLDDVSQTVTVEAGVRGDHLEEYLGSKGLTAGHYPQSINISTVGGWIAASGAGQATPAYGPIESRVAGLTVVLYDGTISRIKAVSRWASGPDLRRLILGSEGNFGIVTEAVLVCENVSAGEAWQVFVYETYAQAIDAARDMLRAGVGPRVLRGWDVPDSKRAFGPFGLESGCVGMIALAADAPGLDGRQEKISEIAAGYNATPAPAEWGDTWWAHRLDAVELFENVMGPTRTRGSGVILDTFEVSGLWSQMATLHEVVGAALRQYTDEVRAHFSHVYQVGSAHYFTFVFHGKDDQEVEQIYLKAWNAAMDAAIAAGGSISHHHGIGRLKAGHLEGELGEGAFELLKKLKGALDPDHRFNPGVLLPAPTS